MLRHEVRGLAAPVPEERREAPARRRGRGPGRARRRVPAKQAFLGEEVVRDLFEAAALVLDAGVERLHAAVVDAEGELLSRSFSSGIRWSASSRMTGAAS